MRRPPLPQACDAYLATLAGPESVGTRRVYGAILRELAGAFGADGDVAALQPRAAAAWFTSGRSVQPLTPAMILVGLTSALGSCPGALRCRGNDRYPYTAERRDAVLGPAGHSVGKQCRENYVA